MHHVIAAYHPCMISCTIMSHHALVVMSCTPCVTLHVLHRATDQALSCIVLHDDCMQHTYCGGQVLGKVRRTVHVPTGEIPGGIILSESLPNELRYSASDAEYPKSRDALLGRPGSLSPHVHRNRGGLSPCPHKRDEEQILQLPGMSMRY